MKKRTFLKNVAMFSAAIGAMGFKRANAKEEFAGPFVHVVFFWLKEPENKESRKKFEKELRAFIENIPEIASNHIGVPADTPDRPVVDNSFSYCLVTSFKSRKEYDIYADHPLHVKFVENAGDLWDRVVVHDSNLIQ